MRKTTLVAVAVAWERIIVARAGEDDTRYLTMGEAARRLGVSRHTLARATRRGEIVLAARTPGGHYRFRAADVTAYAARLAAGSDAPWADSSATSENEGGADAARLAAIVATQRDIALAALDRTAVMSLIVERARALTRAEGAVIELAEGDAMVYRAVNGTMSGRLGLRLPLDGTLSGWCVRTDETTRCNDTQADPRTDAALCRRLDIGSMILAPLHHERRLVGVLKVLSPRTHAFTDRDVQTLELIGGLCGAALSHASAFEAMRTLVAEGTEALNALRESEERLRTVITSAPIILFALDPDGVYTLSEGAGLAALGREPGAVVGLSVFDVFHDHPNLLDDTRRALRGETVTCVSHIDEAVFENRLVPLRDDHGRVVRVIGISTDITERERAEEAERAVRARDAFLSVAAHELKTPLTSLRGFTQLLLRTLDNEAPPHPADGAVTNAEVWIAADPRRIRHALRNIETQTEKLNRLIGQLLDVSRLEGDRLELDREDADIARIVTDMVMAARAQTSAHTLVVTAPPTLPARVDPLRLEQVLINLLGNAIKYSPDGGRIDVMVEPAPDGDVVRVMVRDHGIGIPEDHRARIFDRFYQAHASSHRSGLGLGLYISRRIVEHHGGRLEAAFPSDGGTLFVIHLPLNTVGQGRAT